MRSHRWIQRDPPESFVIDEVLKSLRRYLGKAGYDWLSACAVFPELHWNLTLYLGNTLQSEDGRTLLQACHLNDLTRLPWFRQGYMPDWLRKRLISEIPRPQEQDIRSAIEVLLIAAVQGSVGGLQLEIARTYSNVLSVLAQPLLRLLAKRASEDSLLRDYIFQDFMTGSKQKQLAVRLPEALYDLLHPQRIRWGLWLRCLLGTTLSSPQTRLAFSRSELLAGAAFSGFQGALIAIAVFSLLRSPIISLGISFVILGVLIFAQARRWIEKLDLLTIPVISVAIIYFIPLLRGGLFFQTVLILAVAAALVSIMLISIYGFIYKLLSLLP